MLRRLLTLLGPYRRASWISLGLAWLAMLFTVVIPLLVGHTIDAVRDHDSDAVVSFGLAIVAAGLIRLGLTVIRRIVAGKISLWIEYDLREKIYGHLQRLELGFFDAQQTGQLMSRATADLQAVRFFLGYGLVFISQSGLTILLASVVMIAIKPWLAAIALLPVPLVVFTAARFNRRSRPTLAEVQQRLGEVSAEIEESVAGVRVIKAFGREREMRERFALSLTRLFDQNLIATRLRAFYNPLIGFLPNLGLAAILLIGGNQVISGGLTLGEFTAFNSYLLMLIGPMRMLGVALGMSQRAFASGDRIFALLDREPQIVSAPGAHRLPAGPGRVEFHGVELDYNPGGSAQLALRQVDLRIEPGRTIALVGPTASGKTSLVALLARLYDPSRGRIELDGHDLRQLDLGSLRSEIAFVSEDSFLFSASIADNIAYARPEASAEAIATAARRAQAAEFIERLPDRYATIVGERGLTLSGGQRQRIAIARALLADPRILVLDDATSSVDASTEAAIRAGLAEALADRTTFIIAHRLSSISLADEVVVLEGGRVIDRGSHLELTGRCPLYAEIAEFGLEDAVFLQRDLEDREELARL